MVMKPPLPKKIQKHSDTEMAIEWQNEEASVVPFKDIRFHCRCAECVDEWTRVRRVKMDQIRADIKPTHVEPVGRYAVQISWNDGHRSGIYPFQLLYSIAKGSADQYDQTREERSNEAK